MEELPTIRPESSESSAMGCVGYNLRARMALAVLVGHAIVKHLAGAMEDASINDCLHQPGAAAHCFGRTPSQMS
jgi:hypothetical protein